MHERTECFIEEDTLSMALQSMPRRPTTASTGKTPQFKEELPLNAQYKLYR